MTSIIPLLEKTQLAAPCIRNLSDNQKQELLFDIAQRISENTDKILAENAKDVAQLTLSDPKKDRLLLNDSRLVSLVESLRQVAQLANPAGRILTETTLEQGLKLKKMSVPLGVIYESRPNVTVDVAALCLRSGNACVLKGGKEAWFSNHALVSLIHESLMKFELDKATVTLLPADRKYVDELLTAVKYIDMIIPRGSEALIQFVRKNSLIPTIETGAGVCHTYVQESADLEKAKRIVINAKVSRPSVCNSLDTILVDKAVADKFLPTLKEEFQEWKVEVFADAASFPILAKAEFPNLKAAVPNDFGREFLDYKCSVKIVNGLEEALTHIRTFSSRHSEAIVAEDNVVVERFLSEVDAAAVYANASTRFTDGGIFGLGAEIGISTQKLHARGPFALEKLVTEKWIITGNGQIRE